MTPPAAAAGDLTIGFDGRSLIDDSRHRGIGTYLRQLLDGIGARAGFRTTLITVPRSHGLEGPLKRLIRHPKYQAPRQDWLLPRLIDRTPPDVFHSPAQSPPRKCPVPWVQTLHDLTPLVYRDPALAWEAQHWQRVGPRLLAASAVICDSASSADQAMRFFDVPSRLLHVIPLGVEAKFTPDGPRHDHGVPYLLWVSAWGPHKGLDDALEVIGRLAEAGHPHSLLIAGPQHEWGLMHMNASIARSARPDRVEILGYVDDLGALYRGADALLVTSRAEGFCLPALEAMACGVPVVSYDNTALPERVEGAGILVPDGDPARFAAATGELLGDPLQQQDLIRAGLTRAANSSWSIAIDQYAEIYRRVADGVAV